MLKERYVTDSSIRTYVLDTSVMLSDPWACTRFAEHEVVVPLVVISELEAKRHHHELGWFARQALRLGTFGGARVLGRASQIGSLEPGKLADLVLWRMDTLAHASIADPVTALVLGAAAPVTASFVNGRQIVEDGRLLTADEDAIARATREEARRLARIAAQG